MQHAISFGFYRVKVRVWVLCNTTKKQCICYLDAFNFNSQSLKLPDEYGPIIQDHLKQHCCNKQ